MKLFSMAPVATLAIVLPLTACAPMDCTGDPNTASLMTAARCLPSGYEARNEALRATLQDRVETLAALESQRSSLSSELASLNTQERQVANRMLSVNRQISDLQAELEDTARTRDMTQAEYDALQAQLDAASADLLAADPADSASAARVSQLEQEVAALRRLVG